MTAFTPLDVHGPHGFGRMEESSLSVLPFLGSFLLILLLASLAAWYLWRRGTLTLPRLAGSRSPEDDARRILADRFARGDISSDDFLERASILNWTPGNDTLSSRPRKKRL